jgi:hypothetical protein
MKALSWAMFLLISAGIVYFGWARAALATLLIGGGLFVIIGAYLGLRQCVRDEKNKRPDPVPSTVADDELVRLRRLAGLKN